MKKLLCLSLCLVHGIIFTMQQSQLNSERQQLLQQHQQHRPGGERHVIVHEQDSVLGVPQYWVETSYQETAITISDSSQIQSSHQRTLERCEDMSDYCIITAAAGVTFSALVYVSLLLFQ